ncbi:hypothetical protein HY449_01455 [Candidatus Pacearchaeota archaeon]|nr:hypothetical protein [Candidatus Pacearchaeota archaeon]
MKSKRKTSFLEDLIGWPIAAGIVISYMLNVAAILSTCTLLEKGYTKEQIEGKEYRIILDDPIIPHKADLVKLTDESSQGYKFYKTWTRPGRELGYLTDSIGESIKDFTDEHLLESIIKVDRKIGRFLLGEEYGRYEGEEYYKIDE